ncbi:MAG: TIGR01212 family radical SAM protein [Lachnospiraceae bacterium]|nr:TIGR01212 family radical SAM protein [Lachnospiraceae bacterium]
MTDQSLSKKQGSCRWGDKPYHSLDYEMKRRFGEKVYKIALEGGMTCPNRDGTLDTRGCIFCSGKGSGDFAAPRMGSITEQIDRGIREISARKQTGKKFIAYFQSFTNTYAPVSQLTALYEEALAHPDVVMLSIATRPDCLPEEVLELLRHCAEAKPTIVELGLQTIHSSSADYIRRGYSLKVYDTAVEQLKKRGLEVVTHVIAGLPFESKTDFLETVTHVADSGADGIKLQLLHVLEGTDLAEEYRQKAFEVLSREEYLDWIVSALSLLPEQMVIHRLTGDGPKKLLLAPLWSSRKREVLNLLHQKLRNDGIWQGCHRPNNE